MANFPIKIQGINNDSTLILSDSGFTKVQPGDTVTWIIEQNSGVASIIGIRDDSTPIDVFNPDPAPVGNSSNWQGTVSLNITAVTEESYTILYTADNDDKTYSFDPKIQVNP